MNSQDLILTMMRAQGKTDALSLRSRSAGMDGTAIIAEEEKIPAFNPEKDYSSWPAGAPVTDEGQVWTLIQPYNAANYDGRPSTLRALWGLAHTKNPVKGILVAIEVVVGLFDLGVLFGGRLEAGAVDKFRHHHFTFLLVFSGPGLYTKGEGSFPLPLSAGVSPLVACPAWVYCWA